MKCPRCQDETISESRVKLGYRLCLSCGEVEAKRQRTSWTIVPLHKSSYMLVTDKTLLSQLNKTAA